MTGQGQPNRAKAVETVLAEFRRQFEGKFKSAPERHPSDRGIVVGLLRDHPVAEIVALLAGFFAVGTAWVRQEGAYSLRAFRHAYNDLVAMRAHGIFNR
jgi:hypothetical protein